MYVQYLCTLCIVCMNVSIYVFKTLISICMHVSLYVVCMRRWCMYVYMYVCLNICIEHTNIHTFITNNGPWLRLQKGYNYMYSMYVCMYSMYVIYTYVFMSLCKYARMNVCKCVNVCNHKDFCFLCIYIWIYVYVYTVAKVEDIIFELSMLCRGSRAGKKIIDSTNALSMADGLDEKEER